MKGHSMNGPHIAHGVDIAHAADGPYAVNAQRGPGLHVEYAEVHGYPTARALFDREARNPATTTARLTCHRCDWAEEVNR